MHCPEWGFFERVPTGLSQEEAVAKAQKILKKMGYTKVTTTKREDGKVVVTGENPEFGED